MTDIDTYQKRRDLEKWLKQAPHRIPINQSLPLIHHPDRQVRHLAAKVLVRANYLPVFPILVHMSRESNSQTRIVAVSLIRDVGFETAIPALLDRLNDKIEKVRILTATALMNLGQKAVQRAADRFIQFRPTDRALVIRAFSDLSLAGEEILEKGLQDEEAWIRKEAIKSLSKKKSEKSTLLLMQAARDSFAPNRVLALQALKHRKDSRIKNAVRPLVQNSHIETAAIAERIIKSYS